MLQLYTYNPKESEIYSLHDLDINDIAIKLYRNELFHSSVVPKDLWSKVFMPLLFMDDLKIKKLQDQNVSAIIARMNDTFGMSLNGFPIFHTIQMIRYEDDIQILERYNRIQRMMKNV